MLGVSIIKKDKLLEILHEIDFDDPHPSFYSLPQNSKTTDSLLL